MKKEKDYYARKKREKEQEIQLFLYGESEESDNLKEALLKISLNSFQKLNESCQQILRFYYVNKNSMAEIGEKMGFANANTVKVTKARCYKKWLEITKKTHKDGVFRT